MLLARRAAAGWSFGEIEKTYRGGGAGADAVCCGSCVDDARHVGGPDPKIALAVGWTRLDRRPASMAAAQPPPCSDCGRRDFEVDAVAGKATCRCGLEMPWRKPAAKAAKKGPPRIQKWYAEMSKRLGGVPAFVIKDAQRVYSLGIKDPNRRGCTDLGPRARLSAPRLRRLCGRRAVADGRWSDRRGPAACTPPREPPRHRDTRGVPSEPPTASAVTPFPPSPPPVRS